MKLKKLFSASVYVLTSLALLLSMPQTAYAAEESKVTAAPSGSTELYEEAGLSAYEYITLRNEDIEITGFNGFARELTVPSDIDGHTVAAVHTLSLPDGVFSVTIPGTAKRIGKINGGTLIKVTLSEGVEEIAEYAFGYRTDAFSPVPQNLSLVEVELPSTLKKIGEGAFEGCANLKKINLSQGCEIGKRAFYQCSDLPCPEDNIVNAAGTLAFADTNGYYDYKRIKVENDCYILGNRLIDCRSKERVLEIPEGVEYIDCDLIDLKNDSTPGFYFQEVIFPSTIKEVTGFDNCQELVKVTFKGTPEKITSFDKCPKLSDITFPEGTKTIGGFSECPSLTSIDIPSSVEVIEGFRRCENLESVTFHDGHLKVIEGDSFSECGKLNNVFLPSPLEEIGEGAFTQCPVLKNITFPDTVYRVFTDLENEPWYYEQPLGEPLYIGSCYMGFPYDYYEEYPESVTLKPNTLGINAKYGPTKYDLPASLKFVGKISNLDVEDLVLPEGVEYIAKWSITDNENVKTITIPKSVKYVGYQAMEGCSNLEKVTFKGNPEFVDDLIFRLDSKLEVINVPDDFDACVFTKTSDGYYESYQKGYTTESWVGTSEKEYKDTNVFGFELISITGDDLENIVIPENVGSVEITAPNIKTLTVPDTVRSLSINGKTKLTELDLPDGIQKVYIYDSTSLKTINAPDSLIDAYCSENTAWYKSQPDGPLYLGKCLIGYKGEMPDNYKLVVPEGITSVCNFPSNDKLTELVLPSSCRFAAGFGNCYALSKLDWAGRSMFTATLLKEHLSPTLRSATAAVISAYAHFSRRRSIQ